MPCKISNSLSSRYFPRPPICSSTLNQRTSGEVCNHLGPKVHWLFDAPNDIFPRRVEMDHLAVSHPHILTVTVEDYFQGTAFADIIDPRHWSRFEAHIERN